MNYQQFRRGNSGSAIKVSLIVKELCSREWISTAEEFIYMFKKEVEQIKTSNCYTASIFYRTIKLSDYAVEVWRYNAKGDKEFLMFKVYKP